MSEFVFIYLMIMHWLADFVFQTHEEATNKSRKITALLSHTITYSCVWFFAIWGLFFVRDLSQPVSSYKFIMMILGASVFSLITFVAHTITDYFTSRWVRHFFDKKDFHNGFVIIGIDQILHYLQLYFTYKMLFI